MITKAKYKFARAYNITPEVDGREVRFYKKAKNYKRGSKPTEDGDYLVPLKTIKSPFENIYLVEGKHHYTNDSPENQAILFTEGVVYISKRIITKEEA